MLDEVVREVMMELCGLQEAHHGLGWAEGGHNIVLYEYDSCIAVHNLILGQKTLIVVVCMFDRVGLQTKLGKKKAMVCAPSLIWGQQI